MKCNRTKRNIGLTLAIILAGSMGACNTNGRDISIVNGDVYVDGVHYVPASESNGSNKLFNPGKTVEHKFNVTSNFNSVVVNGFMNVVFTQSDKVKDFEVKGKIPENLIERLEVYVEHGTLYISMKKKKNGHSDNIIYKGEKPTIFITNKALKEVTSSGSGDFSINGNLYVADGGFSYKSSGSGDLKADKIRAQGDITLSTSGSGDIELNGVESANFLARISGSADIECGGVKTQNCTIEIAGSGDVKLSGSTESVEFSIAGSGDIDASNLKAKTGKASVSGSGDIRCNVERLSERVRGSGDIHNRY